MKFWSLLGIVFVMLLLVSAAVFVAADQPVAAKHIEMKSEWITPVGFRVNGLDVVGFVYTGPGQLVVQNQTWVAKDPLDDLKPIRKMTPVKK